MGIYKSGMILERINQTFITKGIKYIAKKKTYVIKILKECIFRSKNNDMIYDIT